MTETQPSTEMTTEAFLANLATRQGQAYAFHCTCTVQQRSSYMYESLVMAMS